MRDIDSMKLDLSGLRSDIGALRLDFVEFRASMRTMTRLIAGAVAIFGTLVAGSWMKLAETSARLDERIAGVERSVDALSERVDALSGRVEGIADRLAKTEGKIDALAVAVAPPPPAIDPTSFDPAARRAVGPGDDPSEPPLTLPDAVVPRP